MLRIEPYIHRCTFRTGDMEGSKYQETVTSTDIQYSQSCSVCGEALATPSQIIAHIYEQLTGN